MLTKTAARKTEIDLLAAIRDRLCRDFDDDATPAYVRAQLAARLITVDKELRAAQEADRFASDPVAALLATAI